MELNQETDIYGIIGYPLGHSLSPVMHNAAFLECGVNALYLPFETRDIKASIRGVKSLGIRGMSVTIPYKTTVMPLLDQVHERAKRIGAVNTILNKEGRLIGYNTDALGALRALESRTTLPGKTCLVIGAGGAARAIGAVLKERDVRVIITNRSLGRGEELAISLECSFVPLGDICKVQTDLVVQTTPVGMHPHEKECIIPGDFFKNEMTVMDIIYNPLETKFLSLAKTEGCSTINGLDMFIYQGAEQYTLWTGLEAPTDTMTKAVKEALES